MTQALGNKAIFMEHQKKILFIHHGKGLGGAPLSLLYLVQQLSWQLYRPVVVFLHNSAACDLFKKNNIPTVGPIGWYDFAHTKIWWFRWYHPHHVCRAIIHTIITFFIIAPKIYRKERPALVHLNTSSLIAWGAAAWFMHIPIVWHIREPLADGYYGLRKNFIRWCVATFATTIVAISKNDGLPWTNSKKLLIIYNAVPPEQFDSARDKKQFCEKYDLQNSLRILFVGGCSREKGTLPLLYAFEQVLKKLPTTQLLIAGYFPEQKDNNYINLTPSSRYIANVLSVVAKHPKNVVLLGAINDIPAAMAASDIIVFPATVGHFARPIIEAGFMKKPVIASCLAPLDELVIDKTTGLLIPHNNSDAWADALILLLTDQQKRISMGQAGYEYCTTKFSLLHQRNQIAQLYENILKGDHHEPLGS